MRTNSGNATVFALVSATLMIAHQVGGKATRDAIFLSQFDITQLPKVVMTAALVSMSAVVLMSYLLARYGPQRIVPGAFLLSALLFIVSWLNAYQHPRVIALVLYLQMAVFGAVLISGFWSVINERFDPHTAKRTVAEIAAAATLGGVLGGALAEQVARLFSAPAMILILGLLHGLCALTVSLIGSPRAAPVARARPETRLASGFAILRRNRYLQLMGALMVLIAILAALIDYVFKAEAVRHLVDEAALVGFFGRFYAVAGVITFALQSVLGPRVLSRLGIGTALASLPVLIVATGMLNLLTVRLWPMITLRGAQMVLQNSFFRSAFEILYTPLPPPSKRPTKSIIDVASDRAGDICGSGIVLVLLALVPALSSRAIVVVIIAFAIATLFVVNQLYRAYVAQLADNLRDGVISLQVDSIVDATTRHVLAETSPAAERTLLTARIAAMKAARDAGTPDFASKQRTELIRAGAGDRLAAAIGDLCSGDVQRVRGFLHSDFMDPRLALFIVPILALDELAELARTELRFIAPRCIGGLTDALFDPDVPLLARQRLPSVLEVTPQPRAITALTLALFDQEFNVRYSAARALSRMRGRDPELTLDRVAIFAACERELKVPDAQWQRRDLGHHELVGDHDHLAAPAYAEANHSLEHVFTILSLVLDRDALRLSLRAVFSRDRAIRGNALEYLENVLPDGVRAGLWPHLGADTAPAPKARGAGRMLDAVRNLFRRRTRH